MFSVIYTPTEADAIQNYSRIFRDPDGCFLNIRDQDKIEECLSNFSTPDDIDYIVVSDGEQVKFDISAYKWYVFGTANAPAS
jgi:malate dehydrogenase (oxaloacetate-decarboxylating)